MAAPETDINWPQELACVLRQGYDIRYQNPLMRTDLVSGRAVQRRRFTSVPAFVSVNFMMNDAEAMFFDIWFKSDQGIYDGAAWFNIDVLRTPIGNGPFVARFTGIPDGPTWQATSRPHWLYVGELEIWERPTLPDDWAEFPDYVINGNIIDMALNREWPEYLEDSQP